METGYILMNLSAFQAKVINMNVLIVSQNFPKSEQEIKYSFISNEVNQLSKQYDINIATGHNRFNISFNSILNNIIRTGSLRVIPIVPFVDSVIRAAKKFNPHLIHAHFAYPEGYAAMIASEKTGIPYIVTLHGFDILTNKEIGYGLMLNKTHKRTITEVLKNASKVIVASTTVHDAVTSLGIYPEKIAVIPYNAEKFFFEKPKLKTSNKSEFRLLFTGHLTERKGVKYLIDSVAKIKKSFNGIKLVIVGDGNERKSLEAQVKMLGLEQNIMFLGSAPNEELKNQLYLSDVFVLPSLCEAFGIVVVEAMACGKPVIATDFGAARDLVKDGINGFLVRPKDSDALSEKILHLMENKDVLTQMGGSNRKKANDMSDRTKLISKVYDSFLV